MSNITLLHNSPVLQFAAEELTCGLQHMGITECTYSISLGLFSDLNLVFNGKDPLLDDEIAISVQNGRGYLAGSNPRSVLFAVYRYLETCGVCYLRPGANGTRYPSRQRLVDVQMKEAAMTRHRSICIEGAVSLTNVLDMVDWMPKLGFNSYYIQFRDAFIFFDRWYSHRKNPLRDPEPISHETALEYVQTIKHEVKKRGLLLEAVGHGWTCEPFGVAHSGWDKTDTSNIPQKYLDVCALVNGERKVWNNRPLDTQLCLSNPAVRSTMNKGVLQYIRENPEADIIHYWMGDWCNNVCECDECSKLHVTDWYVMLLNELDELLTQNGLPTRIVFENCYNYSIPPMRERLNNQNRFIMLWAPITRTYSESFPDSFSVKEIPPYVCNKFEYPLSTADNLAYLYAWRQQYSGDAVDYDYHLMWDHLLDGSGENVSKILYQDIKNFKALTLDGFISCQLQRNAFPTSLAMSVMGKTLWNTNASFDDIRSTLYTNTFGVEALAQIKDYLSVLSKAFDVGAMRCHKAFSPENWKQTILDALAKMDVMEPIICQNCSSDDPVTARSWQLLQLQCGAYRPILHQLLCLIDRKYTEATSYLEKAIQFVWEHEDQLQEVLDCYFFDEILRARINLESSAFFPENNN